MKVIIGVIIRLIRVGRRAFVRKWSFLTLFAIAFFGSVAVLGRLDFLPEAHPSGALPAVTLVANQSDTANASAPTPPVVELPMKIEIPKINLSAIIANPTTTDIRALDTQLLSGAVRYPTSARLGETGTLVLFGHSSYLPIVKNQAYKTFNGIQKLAAGDTVIISAADMDYSYRVRNVVKERADDNTAIPLSVTEKVLTLVTCDSFGTKEDRFVVTADFVESHSTSSQG